MGARRNKVILTITVIFLSVMAILAFLSNTISAAMLPKVTTERASVQELEVSLSGRGTLQPKEKADVMSDTGFEITDMRVKEGDHVKRGQVLFTLDATDLKDQIADERTRLQQAGLGTKALQQAFIDAQLTGDPVAIDKAKRDLENDRLNRILSERKIARMEKELVEKSRIKAPFDGVIQKVNAKKGDTAAAGKALASVMNTSAGYQFSFTVSEGEASILAVDEKIAVRVKQPGGKEISIQGKVSDMSDASSSSGDAGNAGSGITLGGSKGDSGGAGQGSQEDSGSKMKITIEVNDPKLHGGESVSVSKSKSLGEKGIVISKDRLKKDADGSYLLIVRTKKSPLGNSYVAEKARVRLGAETKDKVIVAQGLNSDDDIIVETSEPLQDGNEVRVK
ncbi:efflux RND transporter periplasmic adaptor subunit [Paenibacillus guangzhouensis]|uniref:efflux RND transporter periplasmic adaptor subunit n=1 Tax=Paenibacillus guangzhouensis TaxID=1473112 RepID=UPI0012672F7A|nr:biotin/lipoyl-binding protein [Paenibacillus guangzhouensis]